MVLDFGILARRAEGELRRVLLAMAGDRLTYADTIAGQDSFVLGTVAEVEAALPQSRPSTSLTGNGYAIDNYYVKGKQHREKVGSKAASIKLYRKRKEDQRAGRKLGNLRNSAVLTLGHLFG